MGSRMTAAQELRNTDVDASWPNKVIDLSLANTTPNALMDLEQPESSICTTGDMRVVENLSVPEATKNNIGEKAPIIHITVLDYELSQIPQAFRYCVPRKNSPPSMPSNLSHSCNVFSHKEKDGCEVKSRKTESVLKPGTCTKMSQDFIILGKSSIQHQSNKTKNQISCIQGQSYEDAGISLKLQKKQSQKEKCHFDQRNQKPPKQVLPCISKSSVSLGKTITPVSVRQAQSTLDIKDLNYSDMFKEILSNDKGPGIYEMFGTPVYSREPTGHENGCCRNVRSAPARRLRAIKPKSNHLSEKKNRARNTQRRTYPKPHKNPPGIKQKHKDLMPREASELEDSSQEQGEGIGTSSTDGQINTSRNSTTFYEDDAQQLPVSTELTQSGKPNEVIPISHLAAIEETSLEHSSDVGDHCIPRVFVSSFQELLWPQVKDHAKYASFLSSARERNENKNLKNSKCLKHRITEALNCHVNQDLCSEDNQEVPSTFPLPERVPSSPRQNLQHGNVNLANASAKWTCHSTSPFPQTCENILSCTNSEEIAEDLLCCLAAQLLSLDDAEASDSRAVMKNENGEAQKGYTGNKEATATNNANNKNCCPTILESNGENRFCSAIIFSESSLTNEDPIMWTKGEILGKGAYGTVYCGLTSQGQLIAVKQVALDSCDQAETEKGYQKLQEEVEILKTLKHINIVGYLGTCLKDNIVSIFMEFVPGGSISSIIHRFGPLPEIVFCKYTRQILHGVAYLHENHVVHRDIKGNNVMLMPNGVIKLIDFGCAKRLACVSLTDTHSDPLKSVHGTPYWMAPEVINESGYGRKSDVWSIGCTVFEMATGKPPLASMDRIAAMFYIGAHRGLMPPIPSHCSRKAADFVHVCLTR
ncbi:mitogen-activated protein kinase kinase kinase 19 isoform X2 [Eublepharis macularius]|nr:mitogen-activated protein kinase kinase kinase 19 isoform X2 [Eublepharis macularius]